MPPINNITILGGGLTGLTLAYRLSRLLQTLPALSPQTQHARAHRDTKITLLEKSDRAGGWVHSSNRIVQIPRTSENGEGKKVEEVVNVDITLEAGPRSIRPKGSIGAAYMLKLVSCPLLSFSPPVLDSLSPTDPRSLAGILYTLRFTYTSIGAKPIHPVPRDRSPRSTSVRFARCNGRSIKRMQDTRC
jgi:oxygen-dependent protoporphyrinogen oxidase